MCGFKGSFQRQWPELCEFFPQAWAQTNRNQLTRCSSHWLFHGFAASLDVSEPQFSSSERWKDILLSSCCLTVFHKWKDLCFTPVSCILSKTEKHFNTINWCSVEGRLGSNARFRSATKLLNNGSDSQNAFVGLCCDGTDSLKRTVQHKTRCHVLGVPSIIEVEYMG